MNKWLWNIAGCHFTHHKSQTDRCGIEASPGLWDASVQPPEHWHYATEKTCKNIFYHNQHKSLGEIRITLRNFPCKYPTWGPLDSRHASFHTGCRTNLHSIDRERERERERESRRERERRREKGCNYKNNQQDALYRLIYYSKSALRVSSDVFAHHQEHLTVFTVPGSAHPSFWIFS